MAEVEPPNTPNPESGVFKQPLLLIDFLFYHSTLVSFDLHPWEEKQLMVGH